MRVLPLRVEETLRVERHAPPLLDAHDVGAATARDLAHPVAEHAVRTDDRGVTGFEEVHEARFHPRRAGTRQREGERVVGAEHEAQPRHGVVEQREELGIHVPEQGPREARRSPRGTGSTDRGRGAVDQ